MASTSSLRLKSASTPDDSEFMHFRATMRLPIAPVWGANGNAGGADGSGGLDGVREVLSGWVMRYLPPLRAVLLTFDPLPAFAHPTALFPSTSSPFPPRSRQPKHSDLMKSPEPDEEEDEEVEGAPVALKAIPMIMGSGFALATIEWQGLGWRPTVGQQIVGSTTISTPSHISLLLHNLFNASIPASHIPTDTYHFDPDFPVPSAIQLRQKLTWPTSPVEPKVEAEEAEVVEEAAKEEDGEEKETEDVEEVEEEMEVDDVKIVEDEDEQFRERGWWRHNVTNEPLGGPEGLIEFTIVGLTIANSMISVTGSLLTEPFAANAPSLRASAATQTSKKRARANSESSSESEGDEPVAQAPPKIEVIKDWTPVVKEKKVKKEKKESKKPKKEGKEGKGKKNRAERREDKQKKVVA